jgi:hypothetical protein
MIRVFAENPNAIIRKISPTSAHISYYPSAALQKEMSAKGISGQFVVQYDVQRGYDAGDIQVNYHLSPLKGHRGKVTQLLFHNRC